MNEYDINMHICSITAMNYKEYVYVAAFAIMEYQNHKQLKESRGLKQITDLRLEKADLIRHCDYIVDYIEESEEQIVKKSLNDIFCYLKEYEVDGQRLDRYKIAYWFGNSIINHFDRSEERNVNGIYVDVCGYICRLSMLFVLDSILFVDIELNLEANMRLKIAKTLLDREEERCFGHYGIYMIFKNIYKAVKYKGEAHLDANDNRLEKINDKGQW